MRIRTKLAKSPLFQQTMLVAISFSGAAGATFAEDTTLNESGGRVTATTPSSTRNSGFNPAMLSGSGEKIDVSRYIHGNVALPGKYRVDVYINQQWLGRRDIDVVAVPGNIQAMPCVTKTLLVQLGVDFSSLPELKENQDIESCIDVTSRIPNSSVDFDSSELRLDVGIPQLYLKHILRGYVDPEEWDAGINAAFINYNVNAIHSNSEFQRDQLFLGTNWGINVEGWRLRYNGTYTSNFGPSTSTTTTQNTITGITNSVQQSGHWQTTSAYAQHDVTSWKSQLTLGDSYTNGDLFNSVAFRGVQLASDDRMLPESQRGYAPVIRGIAETNAKVTVRQGGNVIYETTFPPGEFKIDDMFNSSFAGDFVVTISETDGRQKQYVVPYSAGVLSLRAGATRYSVAVGRLLNVTTDDAPVFSQFTVQHGVGQGVTLYTGAIVGEYYGSGIVGAALNTSLGAFGVDLTHSQSKPSDKTLSGQSWRISYSKLIPETRTNFSAASTSYLTSNFLTLSDAALLQTQQPSSSLLSPRQSFQVNMSQPISEKWGGVYVSGTAQTYWNDAPNSISYQVGYTNARSWGNVGISLSRTLDALGNYHNLTAINLTVPLGNEVSRRPPTLTSSVSYGDQQTTAQLMVNGALGDSGKFNYNAYDNYASAGSSVSVSTNTVGIGGQYTGSAGQAWVSYSSGPTDQATLNTSGAMLLHPGGILFARSLGDTAGIVHAPGAEGTSVTNSNNKIGSSGYSVIPFLNPYINNEVVIDPKGGSMNMELETTSRQVAPRAGAIVLLEFPTTVGRAVLMTVEREDGKAPPMGASILDEKGNEIDMLSQGGRFFNRNLGREGKLTVKWGAMQDQQCVVNYRIPAEAVADQPYQQLAARCN